MGIMLNPSFKRFESFLLSLNLSNTFEDWCSHDGRSIETDDSVSYPPSIYTCSFLLERIRALPALVPV